MTTRTQRVLITAGAGGIGRAISRPSPRRVRSARLRHRRGRVERPGCRRPWHHDERLRRRRTRAVQRMVKEATDALGGLDVLVNNAGIAGPAASVVTLDPDAWESVLRVNLTGTFTVTQAAIPHLKRSAAGSIVVMSSLAGRFGYPNRSPYATTKWGLIGFTKTLSRELGEFGIRVNAILPGAVEARGCSRSSRAAHRSRDSRGRGRSRRTGQSIDQAFRRPGGHRRVGRLPRLGCFALHLRADDPHRRGLSERILTIR